MKVMTLPAAGCFTTVLGGGAVPRVWAARARLAAPPALAAPAAPARMAGTSIFDDAGALAAFGEEEEDDEDEAFSGEYSNSRPGLI